MAEHNVLLFSILFFLTLPRNWKFLVQKAFRISFLRMHSGKVMFQIVTNNSITLFFSLELTLVIFAWLNEVISILNSFLTDSTTGLSATLPLYNYILVIATLDRWCMALISSCQTCNLANKYMLQFSIETLEKGVKFVQVNNKGTRTTSLTALDNVCYSEPISHLFLVFLLLT